MTGMRNLLTRRTAALLCIGLAAFGTAAPASADTFTFNMRNLHPHIIDLRFYSKTRSAVWPGNGQIWRMTTRKVTGYALSCRRGEWICYGATSGKLNWGVGSGNTQGCRNCCYTCSDGGVSRNIDLDN